MPIKTFLASVESLLKQGNATEHSYRSSLETLFTSVIPSSSALNEPKQAEYGAPDFLIQQGHVPLGHAEAKDIGIDLGKVIADSERDKPKTQNGKQLKRYRAALPNLLYTDGLEWYWFVEGEPRLDEPIRVATWDKSKQKLHRSTTADQDLTTLLNQFASHKAALVGTPHDLAHRLAEIARWLDEVINGVLKKEGEQGSLHQQLEAFRETLLPNITTPEFADMYAQTLVYGLFAARVAAPDKPTFTRYDAAQTIPPTNPFLQEMFYQIAGPKLDTRIAWLVDDCARLLERTDLSEVLRDFGKATKQEDPVVHFYETFLAAYDPKTREARGVYYTPEPVVSYIVRSVDHLLRTRFGKSMGLADGETVILDPATGTATFLHAVVQQIHATLTSIGMVDSWNQYVPDELLPRLNGFELLMAPYTIAHLKLSMLLQQLGYTFGSDERLRIYLTNALSDAPTGQHAMAFAQFIAEEGKAADEVKHDEPVMVVLGNPPYSGHSANKSTWIDDLLHGKLPDGASTANYYMVDENPLGERNPKWLQDDYVKFIRFGQWRINHTGEGILAFISNNGYLDNPTFRGMRESLLHEFDTIYILNLHGNSKKQERAPDGSPDENVFDIQQGVAIGLFVKQSTSEGLATVYYADLWGRREGKYASLAEQDVQSTAWRVLAPESPWYLLLPQENTLQKEYQQGWKITDIFPVNSVGIATGQDRQTIALTHQEAITLAGQLKQETETITPALYRPFDYRYMVYDPAVITRPRTEVMQHLIQKENVCFMSTRGVEIGRGFEHIFAMNIIATLHAVSLKEGNYLFPLYLYPNGNEHPLLFGHDNGRRPNLSDAFIKDVEQRMSLSFIPDGSGDLESTIGPEDIFHYVYAILHSPTYRTRYAEFLKIDFPRVPITSDKALFKTLVAKGAALVDLHLLRTPGQGGVGGAGGATILNKPGDQGIKQVGVTTAPIEKITYHEQQQRVIIGKEQYFEGIEPATWAMQIGGYQPLQKWLKDRKGRTLSFNDAIHYMQMVVALRETRRLMQEIDEAVPGWPVV